MSRTWHDVITRGGAPRYPRMVILGQKSRSPTLRTLEKERDMKLYGKLGTVRTTPPPSGFIDSEFGNLRQVVEAVMNAADAPRGDTLMYLEQASDRLIRDSDLMDVRDVVAVLDGYRRCNYFHSKLVLKLASELVYDVSRINDLRLISVTLHAFQFFNVVHPRLLSAMAARAVVLAQPDEDLCSIVRVFRGVPEKFRPVAHLKLLAEIFSTSKGLSVTDSAHTLHAAVKMGLISPMKVAEIVNDRFGDARTEKADLDTLSVLFKVASETEGIDRNILSEWETVLMGYFSSIEALVNNTDSPKTLASITRRNEAAVIAARILVAAHSMGLNGLAEMYARAITSEAARGLSSSVLLALHRIRNIYGIDAVVTAEIDKKLCTFSAGQRAKLASQI
jgi:hypothetical protein